MPELLDEQGTSHHDLALGELADAKDLYLRSVRSVTKIAGAGSFALSLQEATESARRRSVWGRFSQPSRKRFAAARLVGQTEPSSPYAIYKSRLARGRASKANQRKAKASAAIVANKNLPKLNEIGLTDTQISVFFADGGLTAVKRVLARIRKKGLSDSDLLAIVEAFNETVRPKIGSGTGTSEAVVIPPTSFVDRAKRLSAAGNLDSALDVIYDAIDELMKEGRFREIDDELNRLDLAEHSTDMLLGVLTATLPGKNRLPSRAKLFAAVERELGKRGDLEPGLLSGLDG
jgi:hypothetical protein